MRSTYVIGDIHGQYEHLVRLLTEAGLLGASLQWTGGQAHLWFLGDFFDRGPDGVGVVELVMRLQEQALAAGGKVGAVMGNHDPLILAPYHFGDALSGGPGGTFRSAWLANGGLERDLERLRPEHVDWLNALPAMALVEGRLLAHADAEFYLDYGHTVAEVNRNIAAVLQGRDMEAWDQLLGAFCERMAFAETTRRGPARAAKFLKTFGGQQLIHGHTPIWYMTGQPSESVVAPHTYAGGLCVNVDHGLYSRGPGFLYRLDG